MNSDTRRKCPNCGWCFSTLGYMTWRTEMTKSEALCILKVRSAAEVDGWENLCVLLDVYLECLGLWLWEDLYLGPSLWKEKLNQRNFFNFYFLENSGKLQISWGTVKWTAEAQWNPKHPRANAHSYRHLSETSTQKSMPLLCHGFLRSHQEHQQFDILLHSVPCMIVSFKRKLS